jgi:hypothetical protein
MISNVIMSTYYLGGGKDFDSVQEGMMSLAMDFYHYHLNLIQEEGKPSINEFEKSCYFLLRSNTDEACWDECWQYIDAPNPIWSPFWINQALPDLKSGNFIYIPERAEDVLIDLIWQQNKEAFKEEPKMLNVSFSDADLGAEFRVPWGKL